MLFSVARLRHLFAASIACVTLLPLAHARDEVLFTSSVSYCATPDIVLVQQFDLIYFSANQSVFFNISAASVDKNVNVTANLLLNVYGMQPVNVTIDLCDILGGALCPLPTYNFVGSTSIPLPSSINVGNNLPGIAYKIPDLEAFAQLTLRSVDTGDLKACVQSTLSNGWSTRQTGVQWATGGIAFVSFLSAVFHSIRSPEALAPFRFLDMLGLFQTIALSALYNLNYPVVYRQYASNFAWSIGLFSATTASKVQNAINNMRHLTGGTMPDANGGSAVELVNRKLSPYNAQGGLSQLISLFSKRDVQTVTPGSSNILQAGVPIFVNALGISTANAFMSIFFSLLMLIAIALFALAVGWVVLCLILRWRAKRGLLPDTVEEWREYYPWWAKAWALRIALIAYAPIAVFALTQWTLKDSWLSVLLSVIALFAVLAVILFSTFRTVQLVRRERPWTLYRHTPHIMSYGPLYIQYRHERWFFFLLPLFGVLVRAILVAFAFHDGLAQLIVLLILEVALLGATAALRPHETRGGDVYATTLAVVRVVVAAAFFPFVERFGVQAIPRVAIGLVLAVILSLAVVLAFVNMLVNLGLRDLWREKLRGRLGTRLSSSLKLGGAGQSPKNSLSMVEKGRSSSSGGSQEKISSVRGSPFASEPTLLMAAANGADRPRNPTPLQNVPLDPAVNHPYPEVTPTETTATTSYSLSPPPSSAAFTQDSHASSSFASGSTSPRTLDSGFGSLLPRRPSYAGLGLGLGPGLNQTDHDLESGESPATTHFSSAPSTPLTHTRPASTSASSDARRDSHRTSWGPSSTLPSTPEIIESAPGHDRH